MFESILKLLNSNKEPDFLKASNLLIKYANNILSAPSEVKYRKIKSNNENLIFIAKVSGGIECLLEMGFRPEDQFYVMPKDIPLKKLEEIRNELKKHSEKVNKVTFVKDTSTSVKKMSAGLTGSSLRTSEAIFYQKLESTFDRMLVYEDAHLQQKARDAIGFVELKRKAVLKLEAAKLDSSYLEETMLLMLLDWFKKDFFRWMDKPECGHCKGSTVLLQHGTPTAQELSFGASRVEVYQCPTCAGTERFPRYNDPGKLLETRVGRCGEWANCFVLCCRSLSFETRYILDVGDHVWAEVFSQRQQRWLHCDPCENALDKPLLYEKGWGKKLTYVLAFSLTDIQDVSWRYCSDHQALLLRRKECREEWLAVVLQQLRTRRYSALKLPPSRQEALMKRVVVELVDLMHPPADTDEALSARTTGSVEWRLMRGEMGATAPFQSVVMRPSQTELDAKMFTLAYCCSRDCFSLGDDGEEVRKGWQKMMYSCDNIRRKEEDDWKMAYLCRTEGGKEGRVEWKVDLADSGRVVAGGEVEVHSECFEDAVVEWEVSNGDDVSIRLEPNKMTDLATLAGSHMVQLSATLSGGRGDNAWQHAQLFRQALSSDACVLKMRLHLK